MNSAPRQFDNQTSAGGETVELQFDSLKFGVAFALVLTALQRVVGLVRGILFCRVLPEDQLGQWSLTWSYLMLLAPLAVLGLPGSFNRYIETYRQRGQLRSFLVRITTVSALTTVVFSLLLYALAGPVAHLLYRDAGQTPLVVLMAATLFLVVAFNFLASLMEALRQVRLVTVMRLVNGVAFAVFGIAFLFVWRDGAWAVTIGFLVSCVAGSLPAAWYLTRNWSAISASRLPLGRRSMWSRVAPFAAWLWVINIVSNLYETADRNMLLHLAPVSASDAQALVGQYHSGRVIPLVLVGLAAMLSGILMSYITVHWERGEREKVASQLRWTLKLMGPAFTLIGLGVLVVSPLLFDSVLQGRYADGLAVLPMTLVYCIWYSLLTVGQDWLWCREKGKWACLAVITGLLVNLGLNYLFIPVYGLWGAVWATAISNAVALIALYLTNYWFDWRPDRGIWLAALMPLGLLLPVPLAVVTTGVLTWCGMQYGWLFNESELHDLKRVWLDARQRTECWIPGIFKRSATKRVSVPHP